jgi:hypothetical protein
MGKRIIVVPFLKVSGMALYPFILVNDKAAVNDPILINHERIHLRQQAELLVLPFYVLYLLNYVLNRFIYRHHHEAYMHIAFEREAYANETDLGYLARRPWYSWWRFFKLNR